MDVKPIESVQTNEIKKKIKRLNSSSSIPNIIEHSDASVGVSLNDLELVLKPHPKKMLNNNGVGNKSSQTNLRYLKVPPATTGMSFKFNNMK